MRTAPKTPHRHHQHTTTAIARHEVAFYLAARSATGWSTAHDLANAAGIAQRTGRAYARKFVTLGIFDLAEVWPSFRYRWSANATKRHHAYAQRLQQAAEVFGLSMNGAPKVQP